MYKDKERQREVAHKAIKRFRAKQENKDIKEAMGITKGITKGITNQGITLPEPDLGNTLTTTQTVSAVIHKRGKDIKCITIGDQARSIKMMAMLHSDACKRGKDIKVFASEGAVVQNDSRFFTEQEFEQRYGKPKRMTVMERLFYQSASKLGRGETNFVSLPGRACYGVV